MIPGKLYKPHACIIREARKLPWHVNVIDESDVSRVDSNEVFMFIGRKCLGAGWGEFWWGYAVFLDQTGRMICFDVDIDDTHFTEIKQNDN